MVDRAWSEGLSRFLSMPAEGALEESKIALQTPSSREVRGGAPLNFLLDLQMLQTYPQWRSQPLQVLIKGLIIGRVDRFTVGR